MATIIINSKMEDCIKIVKAIKSISDGFILQNIYMPMSIKSVCETAMINPNKGRFIIDDCIGHNLITKTPVVDKNPKYKRYIYTITDKGMKAIENNSF